LSSQIEVYLDEKNNQSYFSQFAVVRLYSGAEASRI
jgi:hypothetical protein